mmetsp:Transcript_31596/g.66903  ORF Transcript_31596/g.66903 Transcript_31596/m.66903 type:complete len:85 (-) Transcript_31596:161-415(-)
MPTRIDNAGFIYFFRSIRPQPNNKPRDNWLTVAINNHNEAFIKKYTPTPLCRSIHLRRSTDTNVLPDINSSASESQKASGLCQE